MALKWIEGFEHDYRSEHATRKYATVTGTNTGSAAGSVQGTCLLCSASAFGYTTPSFGTSNTWVMAFRLLIPGNFTVGNNGFFLISGATEQISLRFVASASFFNLQLSRAGTQVALTTANLPYNTWVYVELKVTIDPTTGAYTLRTNESTINSGSGLNTAGLGSAGADVFKFSFDANASGIKIDDFYLLDTSGSSPQNDFLGDCTVVGRLPTGDGATHTFTPGTGTSHFALVDDPANAAPVDGTDIVDSNTTGNVDLFTFPALDHASGSIFGVMVSCQSAMNAVGSRQLKHKFRSSGASLFDGGTFTVSSTTYQGFPYIYSLDPSTSALWTSSGIDGGQFGLEVL